MSNGTVTKIEPVKMEIGTCFNVEFSAYGKSQKTTARKIVLATGLRDLMPSTPGFRENWGKGIFWCPWCDGHEHADQRLGIIGPLDQVPSTVAEILSLNRDIVAFVNGTETDEARAATEKKSPKWEKYLELNNVTIDNRIIGSIERVANPDARPRPQNADSLPSVAEYDRFRVRFGVGEPVERDAFLVNIGNEQASDLGRASGVDLVDGRLRADGSRGLMTSVDGIYAVGDANSDRSTNVPHALYSGKRAAVYLHGE